MSNMIEWTLASFRVMAESVFLVVDLQYKLDLLTAKQVASDLIPSSEAQGQMCCCLTR